MILKENVIMSEKGAICDVSILKKVDLVYYYNYENREYIIDKGVLKEDNLYTDGVEIHGDGWKQYVSKWFICKVERNGEILFEK